MKQPNQQIPRIHIGRFALPRKALILLGVALPVLFYVLNYSFLTPRNYAAEEARPLEDALMKAGAVKKCSLGDNGRGLDNRIPWYDSSLETNLNGTQAKAVIMQAAASNGLNLTPESTPDGKNTIYRDNTSRSSSYPGLNKGGTNFSIAIYDGSDSISCSYGEPELRHDDNHVAIIVTVGLPSFQCGATIYCNTLPW